MGAAPSLRPTLDLDVRDRVGLDRCSLSNGGTVLVDARTGAERPLNQVGACLAATMLGRLPSVADLHREAARAGAPPESVAADVAGFLEQCDRRQILVVRRALRARFLPASLVATIAALGALRPPTRECRRFDSTVQGTAMAIGRAFLVPVLLAATAWPVTAAFLASTTPFGIAQSALLGVVPFALVVAVATSVVAHELGHAWTAPPGRLPPHVVVAGRSIRLVHDRSAPPGRLCAVAGPFAGAACALVLGGVAAATVGAGAAWPAVAVASVHLCSLCPWATDGRNLWRAHRPATDRGPSS